MAHDSFAPRIFAGALFPISAMPAALTAIAKLMPLAHGLALMRYALVDPHGSGLHEIWASAIRRPRPG